MRTDFLCRAQIPVVFLNSTMPAADRKFAMDALRANPPRTALAYVTPEQVRCHSCSSLDILLTLRLPHRSSRATPSATCSETSSAEDSSLASSSTRRIASPPGDTTSVSDSRLPIYSWLISIARRT